MFILIENGSTEKAIGEMSANEMDEHLSFLGMVSNEKEAEKVIRKDSRDHFDTDSIHNDINNHFSRYYLVEVLQMFKIKAKITLAIKVEKEHA